MRLLLPALIALAACVPDLSAVVATNANAANNAFGPFAFLAPQISILSTGSVLDATALVSADHKYITLNGIQAQNTAFLGSNIELVPFFAPAGVVRQFQGQPRRVLFGTWTGSVQSDGGAPQTVSFDLTLVAPTATIAGHAGEVQADRFQVATGATHLRLAYRLVGKPRRGAGGRVIETFDDHFFDLAGVLSDDGHRLSGRCAHNGQPGTFTVARSAPRLPTDLTGAWRASIASTRLTWKGNDQAVLTLRRDGDRWLAETPIAQAITLAPLFWDAEQRGVVFQVLFQDTATATVQRGFLNGRFSDDGALLRARLTIGTLVDGQADFVRLTL